LLGDSAHWQSAQYDGCRRKPYTLSSSAELQGVGLKYPKAGDAPSQGPAEFAVSLNHNNMAERPAYLYEGFRHCARAGAKFEHGTGCGNRRMAYCFRQPPS
jgi:hypothetical protein